MAVDPVRLDPFRNIVNVGWGKKTYWLQFEAKLQSRPDTGSFRTQFFLSKYVGQPGIINPLTRNPDADNVLYTGGGPNINPIWQRPPLTGIAVPPALYTPVFKSPEWQRANMKQFAVGIEFESSNQIQAKIDFTFKVFGNADFSGTPALTHTCMVYWFILSNDPSNDSPSLPGDDSTDGTWADDRNPAPDHPDFNSFGDLYDRRFLYVDIDFALGKITSSRSAPQLPEGPWIEPPAQP